LPSSKNGADRAFRKKRSEGKKKKGSQEGLGYEKKARGTQTFEEVTIAYRKNHVNWNAEKEETSSSEIKKKESIWIARSRERQKGRIAP